MGQAGEKRMENFECVELPISISPLSRESLNRPIAPNYDGSRDLWRADSLWSAARTTGRAAL
jgi:hypothetical protein